MPNRFLSPAIAMLLSIAAVACAQAPDPADRPKSNEPPPAGFWPTEKMITRMLDRLADGMADHYDFDDAQVEQITGVLKDRIPKWMAENRTELQTLTNEYIEALLNLEPPTKEEVAKWADRALPMVNSFKDLVLKTSEDMKPFMTEDQALKLEGEMAGFEVGMGFANQKLVSWSEGNYDPETEWPDSRRFRDREREDRERLDREMRVARQEARGEVVEGELVVETSPNGESGAREGRSRINRKEQPLDEWGKYVEDYIRRYQFNDDQKSSARRFLSVAYDERDAYLRKRGEEKTRLETALREASGDARAKAQEELDRFNKPMQTMFTKLKERLDRLPTRAQKAAAAERNPTSQPSTSGGGSSPSGTRATPEKPDKPPTDRPPAKPDADGNP